MNLGPRSHRRPLGSNSPVEVERQIGRWVGNATGLGTSPDPTDLLGDFALGLWERTRLDGSSGPFQLQCLLILIAVAKNGSDLTCPQFTDGSPSA